MEEKLRSMSTPSLPVMGLVEIALVLAVGVGIGVFASIATEGPNVSRQDLIVNVLTLGVLTWLAWYALKATVRWRKILSQACQRWGFSYDRRKMMSYTTSQSEKRIRIEWNGRGGEHGPPMVMTIKDTSSGLQSPILAALNNTLLGDYSWVELHRYLLQGEEQINWAKRPQGQVRPEELPSYVAFRWQPKMGLALFDPIVYEGMSHLIASATYQYTPNQITLEMKTFQGPAMSPIANSLSGLISQLIPWMRQPNEQMRKSFAYNKQNSHNRLAIMQELLNDEHNKDDNAAFIANWIQTKGKRQPATFLQKASDMLHPHVSLELQRALSAIANGPTTPRTP